MSKLTSLDVIALFALGTLPVSRNKLSWKMFKWLLSEEVCPYHQTTHFVLFLFVRGVQFDCLCTLDQRHSRWSALLVPFRLDFRRLEYIIVKCGQLVAVSVWPVHVQYA